MKKGSMITGAPWKSIARFAFPVMLGSLLQQLYNTVDTIVVGNFSGEASLSAVGTTSSFTFLFLAIAMGFSLGNGVVVSQSFGAGDTKRVREAASTGIILILSMGVVLSIVGFFIARPALSGFINVPESFLDLAVSYFRIYAVGLVFQFGYNIFSAILRAVGDSAATLYFLLIASVINIVLDIVFVAGLKWGVAGAALATDISQAISFVAAYFYMRRKYDVFRYGIKEYVWRTDYAVQSIKVGFPIGLQLGIVAFGLTAIQRVVNSFGQIMTASFTVGQRIEMYLHLPCNAFQTTLATYTGQNVGADRMDRVKKGVLQTLLMSFVLTFIISGAVWLFARDIMGFFSISDDAAVFCIDHLRTIAYINVILALYVPIFGAFQGANHSGFPTFVATAALGIRVLVTYLFCRSDFFGYSILWWNGLFGFGTGFTVTWLFYLSGKWQKNAKIQKNTETNV